MSTTETRPDPDGERYRELIALWASGNEKMAVDLFKIDARCLKEEGRRSLREPGPSKS